MHLRIPICISPHMHLKCISNAYENNAYEKYAYGAECIWAIMHLKCISNALRVPMPHRARDGCAAPPARQSSNAFGMHFKMHLGSPGLPIPPHSAPCTQYQPLEGLARTVPEASRVDACRICISNVFEMHYGPYALFPYAFEMHFKCIWE